MRRLRSRPLTAAAAAAILAGALTSAVAPGTASTAPGDPDPVAPTVSSTERITLITGDRVRVTTYSDGRSAVTVDPAPRANGATPGFHKEEADGHLYVIPSDATRLVPRRLDRALFDVTALTEQNLDDRATDGIPVIVDYKQSAPRTPLPTFSRTDRLPAIGAAAGDIDKSEADDRGLAIMSGDAMVSVRKIWLDQLAYAADEDSAPQIGAPTAWDAGYTGAGVKVAVLDTGIDTTHPDLQDKVVAEANFSTSPTTIDHYGHGTHVASILAGTGSASDGLRQGIAFEADLMNGKVLDDTGNGELSQVIEGMTWAANGGAEIVNMSLGVRGLYPDGTDPVSQAVNQLTADTGALFVIAAGNDGPGEGTVTTPGAADSALTVGAVDKSDVLAGFSSRGPRGGDFALKPDITAPGVGIIAARADGTSLGTPVDDNYTALDGTSMATPHVAGAAALILQQRPDLTGQQVKALLTSTAVPQDATVYEQGGGRVDLARAIAPSVLPSATSLSMGYFPYPQTDTTPVTKTLAYTNLGDTDVTLTFDADVTDEDGNAPADGMLSVDTDSVTVPGGGSADVTVTVDPSVGEFGLYGGYLTATDGTGKVTRTTLGFYKESERFNLTVTGIARDGRPAAGISTVDVINVDDQSQFAVVGATFTDGKATFRVPPGHYAVMGYLFTYDEPHVFAFEAAAVNEPEVEVAADTEVTLDAQDAIKLDVQTVRPSESTITTLSYFRQDALGAGQSHSYTLTPPISTMYATPTEEVDTGAFEFYSQWAQMAPDIVLKPSGGAPLNAEYVFSSAKLDGSIDTDLVYTGLGKPEDFAAVDVEGKIAVIKRGELTFLEKMHNAEAAGAIAAIIYNHSPGLLIIGGDPTTIPTLAMTQADGDALVAAMNGQPMPVHVEAVAKSPYLYELVLPEPGHVPDDLTYAISDDNTVTIHNRYRSHVADHGVGELRHKWRPWETFSFGFLRRMTAPFMRTEYVSSGDTTWAQYFYGNSTDANPFDFPFQDALTTFQAGRTLNDSWLSQVTVPELWPDEAGSAIRDGQTVSLAIPEWGDPEEHWGFAAAGDTTAFRLYEDGALVGQAEHAQGDFAVGAGAHTYRLELDAARTADWWRMSTRTSTVWTVHSATPGESVEALLLLQADYRIGGIDMLDRAPRKTELQISVSHQPGATAGRIASARLWVSDDDGATWQEVQVHERGGDYVATVGHLDKRAQFVSLRFDVRDAAGNRLQQEVTRAYGLR
ncbi:MAG TPA: S8 family serine peptidase [Nocardioidaceae bacterium]|nr:S8 family serine peptidase [Nocardioidaceae bacterium]